MENELKEKYQKLTKVELVEKAKKLRIKNYSRKKKLQLINAIIKLEKESNKIESKNNKELAQKENAPISKSDSIGDELKKVENNHLEHSEKEKHFQDVSDSRFDLGKVKEYPNLKRYNDLPHSYNDNKIVLLVRDTKTIMAYWELTDEFIESRLKNCGCEREKVEFILRLSKLNDKNDNQNNWDFPLYTLTRNYYLNVPESGYKYLVEFGIKTSDGKFYELVKSNTVFVPINTMSKVVDEQWITMADEKSFKKLYQLSGGETWKTQEGSEHFISGQSDLNNPSSGYSSFESSNWQYAAENDVYLELHTKVVVTGKTTPGNEMFIAGEKINLNLDGSFSIQLNLPDGTVKIPIEVIEPGKFKTKEIEQTLYKISKVGENKVKVSLK